MNLKFDTGDIVTCRDGEIGPAGYVESDGLTGEVKSFSIGSGILRDGKEAASAVKPAQVPPAKKAKE